VNRQIVQKCATCALTRFGNKGAHRCGVAARGPLVQLKVITAEK